MRVFALRQGGLLVVDSDDYEIVSEPLVADGAALDDVGQGLRDAANRLDSAEFRLRSRERDSARDETTDDDLEEALERVAELEKALAEAEKAGKVPRWKAEPTLAALIDYALLKIQCSCGAPLGRHTDACPVPVALGRRVEPDSAAIDWSDPSLERKE